MPEKRKKTDYPDVPFWEREKYMCSLKDLKKGETDGDFLGDLDQDLDGDAARMSTEPSTKRGRPADNDTTDNSKSNGFLHNADGTWVSKGSLRYLSEKARRAWMSLVAKHMAPPTFMQITTPAWDYYARTILNDPKLEFLLLCDDAEWKLKMWSVKAYSCWTGNRGLREKKPKVEKQDGEDILNDKDLIRMDPLAEDDWKDSGSTSIGSHSVDGVNNMVCPSAHRSYMRSPFFPLICRFQDPPPYVTLR